MKKWMIVFASATVLACLSGIPLLAQRGGGHGGGAGGAGGVGGGMGASMGRGGLDNRGGQMGDMHRGMNTTMSGRNAPVETLSRNEHLSSRLQSLLPAGSDLQQASAGFKNLGQFIAAVHVSHNLGIPFDELKAKMTGANAVSLGKAIHELKPDVNAKSETKKAEKQADQDIRESGKES